MKKILLTSLLAVCTCFAINAQSFSINTDGSIADTSAILDIKSTAKGILIPRMTKTQRNAIFQPANGILIYQTGPDSIGFHYYNGSSWLWMATASSAAGWFTTGNAGTDTAVNFIGTTDAMPVRLKQNNQWIGQLNKNQKNFFIGTDAGISNTSGTDNTAFGHNALKFNTSTFANTAVGSFSLQNSTGGFNTAVGAGALVSNTTGSANVAMGNTALANHKTGDNNVALGSNALNADTTGISNVAVGAFSLMSNTNGFRNVAIGESVLYALTKGTHNTVVGDGASALGSSDSVSFTTFIGAGAGAFNNRNRIVGIGYGALVNNGLGSTNLNEGEENTAVGFSSMGQSRAGSRNTALGYYAMYGGFPSMSGNNNIAIGDSTLINITSGSANVAIGNVALGRNTSGWRNVAIGDSAHFTQSFNGGTNYFMDNTAVGSKALFFNQPTTTVNGIKNTAIGSEALYLNTTGQENTAVGTGALHDNITGSFNTAVGRSAYRLSKSGNHGSYMGYEAGYNDSLGFRNTGAGAFALRSVGAGTNNVAFGYQALFNNTTSGNTAMGFVAARNNTIGTNIVAIGDSALFTNSIGNNNVAIGSRSLRDNLNGTSNVAIGRNALENNIASSQNTAIGESAMATMNTSSGVLSNNVAIGYRSLFSVNPAAITNSGNQNTAVGTSTADDMTTGYYNTVMGYLAGNNMSTGFQNTIIGHTSGGITDGSQITLLGASVSCGGSLVNGTALGYDANITQSNSMVFGNTNVTKWGFGTNTTGANVLEFNATVTTARLTTGGVWTNASDRNLKNNFSILNGKEVLNRIMQLPITRWSYKKEGNSITHIGPMAQDFYRLFGTGGDDKTISSIDPSGVALLGIQELKKENDLLKKELAQQKQLLQQLMQMATTK
jgi:trimeric autotransporter adhesin